MARPVWTGSISFGLVNVPVKLFTATEDHTVSFHQLRRGTGERIRHKRVAAESGEEVDHDEIVKGYEVASGEHVVVEPEELEAVEPGRSRSIEIEDFVDLHEIDPVSFRKTYYVAPRDESAARPYELLRSTMADAQRTGIARFVLRNKQHLAAVRPADGVLVLETMYFADEVRDPAAIDEMSLLDGSIELKDRELSTAADLVESLTTAWDPAAYRDTYRERVLELVERKAEGEEIVTEEAEEPSEVVDLMAALERSVSEARGGRRSGPEAGGDRERSKEELYEEAQERDIEGRSKMSKEELAAALREAS